MSRGRLSEPVNDIRVWEEYISHLCGHQILRSKGNFTFGKNLPGRFHEKIQNLKRLISANRTMGGFMAYIHAWVDFFLSWGKIVSFKALTWVD